MNLIGEDLLRALSYCSLVEKCGLPVEGGIVNQAHSFIEVLMIFTYEQSLAERDKWRKNAS